MISSNDIFLMGWNKKKRGCFGPNLVIKLELQTRYTTKILFHQSLCCTVTTG